MRPWPTTCCATTATLRRRDVLVDAEEVVGVILPFQRLQAVVLLRTVRLPHPVFALFHEEVEGHAREVRLERGPEVAHPLALLVEAFRRRRRRADVVGEAGVPPVERGLILSHAGHGAAHLPDGERRERRGDLE